MVAARTVRLALKAGVWAIALIPIAGLLYRFATDDLGANPISFITNTLGDWTLRLLLASLAMTPLRIVCGLSWPAALRRLLGLLAFTYAALHFSVWLVIDHFFDWHEMGRDIVKRPYITVGMTALLLLIPLAATSTRGIIKRMGGTAWRRLHRLAYVAAGLAILHFLWLAKVGRKDQYVYAAVLVLLLSVRIVDAIVRRLARRSPSSAHAAVRATAPSRLP